MDLIEDFLSGDSFAVAGASKDRAKYGNRVLRSYLAAGLPVRVVHPSETEIEGVPCVPTIADLPAGIHGLSIVTPPAVTERLVGEAARAGIRRLWLQPGAESPATIARAEELGLSVIAGGPCLMVALTTRQGRPPS